MTEAANRTAPLFEEISSAFQKLHEKDPEHELLKIFRGIRNEAIYASFLERFGDKDVSGNLRSDPFYVEEMYIRYLEALLEALGESPATSSERFRQEICLTSPSANDNNPIIHF